DRGPSTPHAPSPPSRSGRGGPRSPPRHPGFGKSAAGRPPAPPPVPHGPALSDPVPCLPLPSLRAGDGHGLLDHPVEVAALLRVRRTVVDLLPLPAADDQAAGAELPQVVGH